MLVGNNPQLQSLDLNGIALDDLNLLPLTNPSTGEFYTLKELNIGNTSIILKFPFMPTMSYMQHFNHVFIN